MVFPVLILFTSRYVPTRINTCIYAILYKSVEKGFCSIERWYKRVVAWGWVIGGLLTVITFYFVYLFLLQNKFFLSGIYIIIGICGLICSLCIFIIFLTEHDNQSHYNSYNKENKELNALPKEDSFK